MGRSDSPPLMDTPSQEELRRLFRAQGGMSGRKAVRPASADTVGIHGQISVDASRPESTVNEYERMRRTRANKRATNIPLDANGRPISQREVERSAGVPDGWTAAGRCHIHNGRIGFINGGKIFPWVAERANLGEVRERLSEASRNVASTISGVGESGMNSATKPPTGLASLQELPHEKERSDRVEKTLCGVHQSYFPVSRLWDLRDDNRLMECVAPASIKMGRESAWCKGQMPGWRQRETNLMQLLTLLRRTCSLSDDELDRTKAFLISLADEANPIISRSRFFSIMSVVRAKYGGDVDFLERMARVFNTKGDQQLTFHEMLDGMTILLSGSAEQKFELFFLMYHNVDPRRVGSGARLDRQKTGKGQKHAAASHYCVYLMIAALNKHLIVPALELTGALAPLWIQQVKLEENQYVDDMRVSGHQMLTFNQLWSELTRPVRHRPWLVELIGLDQIEIAEAGYVNASRWHTILNVQPGTGKAGAEPGKFGLQAVFGGARINWMGKQAKSPAGRQISTGTVWAKGATTSEPNISSSGGGGDGGDNGRPNSSGGRRRKNTMSFRRNANSTARFHRGSATLEDANREDAALRGGAVVTGTVTTTDTRDIDENKSSGTNVAVPLYTVALRAAAKAKREIDNGVVWEYDSTVAKQPAPLKAIRWKRFDMVTEISIETGFQANTDHITLSSTTWSLGEEFMRHEGDGAASLRFTPETGTYGRETWHGMTLSNRRSGRTKRVRRYYRINDMPSMTTPRLQELAMNIAITHTVDAAGCMHRDELFKALSFHELAAPKARRAHSRAGLAMLKNAQQSQDQEHIKAAQAAAAKECYSLVYQESNASTGVANVMSVLKRMRQKARHEDESWPERAQTTLEHEPHDLEEEAQQWPAAHEQAAAKK